MRNFFIFILLISFLSVLLLTFFTNPQISSSDLRFPTSQLTTENILNEKNTNSIKILEQKDTSFSEETKKELKSDIHENDIFILNKTNFFPGEGLYVFRTKTEPPFFLTVPNPGYDKVNTQTIFTKGVIHPHFTVLLHKLFQLCTISDSSKQKRNSTQFNPENRIFVDIGTNWAYFSTYAAVHGCNSIMLEANPLLIPIIEMNFELNELTFRIEGDTPILSVNEQPRPGENKAVPEHWEMPSRGSQNFQPWSLNERLLSRISLKSSYQRNQKNENEDSSSQFKKNLIRTQGTLFWCSVSDFSYHQQFFKLSGDNWGLSSVAELEQVIQKTNDDPSENQQTFSYSQLPALIYSVYSKRVDETLLPLIGQSKKIFIMKVDIEGSEMKAIKGCERLLKEKRIENLFVEWDKVLPTTLQKKGEQNEIEDEIKKVSESVVSYITEIKNFGYNIYGLPREEYGNSIRDWKTIKWMNQATLIESNLTQVFDYKDLWFSQYDIFTEYILNFSSL